MSNDSCHSCERSIVSLFYFWLRVIHSQIYDYLLTDEIKKERYILQVVFINCKRCFIETLPF